MAHMSFASVGFLGLLSALVAQQGSPAGLPMAEFDAGAAVTSTHAPDAGLGAINPPKPAPLPPAPTIIPRPEDAGVPEAGLSAVAPRTEATTTHAAQTTQAAVESREGPPSAALEPMGPPAPPKPPPTQPAIEKPPAAPRGLGSALLAAILLLILAQSLGVLGGALLDHGLIPRLIGAAQVVLRMAAVLWVVSALLLHLPPEFEPALPWVLVALAVALGWSAREVLPDLVAGLVLQTERRVRQGQWLATPSFRGQVVELGFRASRIREASGRMLTMPNRRLISEPLEIETGPGPSVAVLVEVPPELSTARAHRVLTEAALLVPWLAPEARIEIQRAEKAGAWIIHAQVIEGRYEEAFAGALREQLDEMWTAAEAPRPSLPPPIPSKNGGGGGAPKA